WQIFCAVLSENLDIFLLKKHQNLRQFLMVFDVSFEQFFHAILPFFTGKFGWFQEGNLVQKCHRIGVFLHYFLGAFCIQISPKNAT
ncbi:MAG: hypothetical protein IJD47_05630, partial [Clostridia bacterium]|nr:hypothetical protein [Clostridia bacterium]